MTTILNAVSPEVKTFIVSFMGVVTVGGLVAKTIGDVKKIFENMGTAEATNGIAMLSGKIANLIPGFDEASGAAKGFMTALATGAATAAISAIVAALGYVISEMIKAREQAEKLKKAENDLSTASDRLVKAASGATSSQKDLAKAIKDVRVSADDATTYINELARKEEELAEKIEGRNFDMEADFSELDDAKEKIDELANSTETLTYVQRNDLTNAIKTVNDVTGSSLEIFDATCGLIVEQGTDIELTTNAIDELVASYKGVTRGKVAFENSADAAKALADAESEVAEKKALVEEKEKALADAQSSYTASTREAVDANLGFYMGMAESGGAIRTFNEDLKNAQKELKAAEDSLASIKEAQSTASATAVQYGNEQATAAAELGWKPIMKALAKGGKNNMMISAADRERFTHLVLLPRGSAAAPLLRSAGVSSSMRYARTVLET